MKKVCVLLMLTAALGMLPSVSQATCNTAGEIFRVFTFPGLNTSTIDMRTSASPATTVRYITTDAKVLNAALTAQASHMRVIIFSNLAVCGVPINGIQAAGVANSITTAP